MSDIFQEVLDKGKPYLIEYLEEMGVEVSDKGNFRCIHPEHNDSDPSAFVIPGTEDEAFHCFGCQASGDIYTAAHYLEGKPISGPGFIKENVEYLLTKFGIEHEPIQLTDEQILKLKYDRLHKAVLSSMFEKQGDDYLHLDLSYAIDTRGWTEETCKKLGIGTIKNYEKFIKSISVKTSMDSSTIEEMGITKMLFGPKLLTFSIKNHKSEVVGFSSRLIDWAPGCGEPKYRNTSETKNPFYRKSRVLFGVDLAKKYSALRLDIFEGYGSYVTAFQTNYKNCVALGGTAFTEEHAQLIWDLGFRSINIVMDVDEVGQPLADKYIEKFSGYQGLKVSITRLNLTEEELAVHGQNDPDYFIRTYGIDEYKKQRQMNAFEHMLSKHQHQKGSDEAAEFATNMVRLLINEENRIERGRMLKTLAAHTGIDREDLEQEVSRIENSEVTTIVDETVRYLKGVSHNADQVEDILESSLSRIRDSSSTKEEKYRSSTAETIEVFSTIFEEMNSVKEGIHGFETKFRLLDEKLDGIARPSGGGVAIGIAGAPSHGKSIAMLNIAQRLVEHNDDVNVLYWAIDDNRKTIAYRLVSMLSEVDMKKVRRMWTPSSDEERKIKEAQEWIIEMTNAQRFIVKDDLFGRSKNKCEYWAKSVQDSTGKDLVIVIDSLHNVGTTSGRIANDERTRLKDVSTWLKSICVNLPTTVLCSLELVKNRGDQKPNLQAISETGKIEFDFDVIAIAWNEIQGKYGKMDEVHAKWGVPGNFKPYIELDIQKNKTSAGEKGRIFYRFDPSIMKFVREDSRIEGLTVATSTMVDSNVGRTLYSAPSDGDVLIPDEDFESAF